MSAIWFSDPWSQNRYVQREKKGMSDELKAKMFGQWWESKHSDMLQNRAGATARHYARAGWDAALATRPSITEEKIEAAGEALFLRLFGQTSPENDDGLRKTINDLLLKHLIGEVK